MKNIVKIGGAANLSSLAGKMRNNVLMGMKQPNFNINHPEKREGEVFLDNCFFMGENYPKPCGWRSWRRGKVAYDKSGKPLNISTLSPVFVKRSEIENSENGASTLKRLLNAEDGFYEGEQKPCPYN